MYLVVKGRPFLRNLQFGKVFVIGKGVYLSGKWHSVSQGQGSLMANFIFQSLSKRDAGRQGEKNKLDERIRCQLKKGENIEVSFSEGKS